MTIEEGGAIGRQETFGWAAQPRAIGRLDVAMAGGRLAGLHQSGASRALFPRGPDPLVVQLNTAGGVTGGDRFAARHRVERGAMTVTTQAAERLYRAQPGSEGRIETRLEIGPGASLHWLPQETIVFEGAALSRSLRVEMAADAELLIVEALLIGRGAMGEEVRDARLRDSIDILRDGRQVAADRLRLTGDLAAMMDGPATGGGARAVASVWLVSPRAELLTKEAIRLAAPAGGASRIRDGVLFARLLAEDGFALRKTLIPLAEALAGRPLPRPWTI